MIEEGQQVYFVRYAFSKGFGVRKKILKRELVAMKGFVLLDGVGECQKMDRDVFEKREDAVAAVNKMKDKRIKSLEKQLEIIRGLDVERMVP